MTEKNGNGLGKVKIHHEAISTIAAHVISDIAGVIKMGGSVVENIAERLGKKTPDKGIKTEVMGNEVRIGVSIVVGFGVKIPEISWQIQKKIRKAVEDMTGLHVASVNVNIEGVQLPEKGKPAPEGEAAK